VSGSSAKLPNHGTPSSRGTWRRSPGRRCLDRPNVSAIFLAWKCTLSVPMIAVACRCTCAMRAAGQAFIGSKQKPKPGLGLRDKGPKCRTLPIGTKLGTGPYGQRYVPR
jgi:hypothetical protein